MPEQKQHRKPGQQRVLVLSTAKKPLMPCHPARARRFLKQGRAAVYRRVPFTIILKDREDGNTQPIECKMDPGAKETGIAFVASFKRGSVCIWAAHLEHRGFQVKKALDTRRGFRKGRRYRRVRHRKARFDNRTRPEGWLPPSLQSRVNNITSFIRKYQRFVNFTGFTVERVKFDMQAMQNPEVSGIEYQQGTLLGYSVKEYLLEKYKRSCCYCGKTEVPLEVEHVVPKSKGGSNRISNLVLACRKCNRKKDNKDIEVFLKKRPDLLKKIKAGLKKPLRVAAAVNATRNKILRELKQFGLPITSTTGARTKYNRKLQGYPKVHWIDAAVLGEQGESVDLLSGSILHIKAMGRGDRQSRAPDKYGFPKRAPKARKKRVEVLQEDKTYQYQTGDLVRAVISKGKYVGTWVGRVTVRFPKIVKGKEKKRYFALKCEGMKKFDFKQGDCKPIQKQDGYAYHFGAVGFFPTA